MIREHAEKYREMKLKMQMKIQEKNVMVSELRQQVHLC
jgi:hypothetical protein